MVYRAMVTAGPPLDGPWMSKPFEPMSMDELLALPTAVDLKTAGRALGLTEAQSYKMAAEGTFPIPLKRYGRQYRGSRAAIFRELDLDPLAVPEPGPDRVKAA